MGALERQHIKDSKEIFLQELIETGFYKEGFKGDGYIYIMVNETPHYTFKIDKSQF